MKYLILICFIILSLPTFAQIRLSIHEKDSIVVNGLSYSLLSAGVQQVNGCALAIPGGNANNYNNGITFGLLGNISKRNNGITIGGLANEGDESNGIMIGGIFNHVSRMNGINIGGLLLMGDTISGFSFAGFGIAYLSIRERERNIKQINGLASSFYGINAEQVNGVSLSLINDANEQNGVAIGLINSSEKLKGVQFGLINHAKNNRKGLRTLPFVNMHLGK